MGFWDNPTFSGAFDWFMSPMGQGGRSPFEYFLPTALTLAGGLLQDDPWAGTEDAARFTASTNSADLMARLAAEKEMRAASDASAEEIAAAQAEAMIEAAKIAARTNAYSNNSRVMADILAERMKARRGIPEVLQRAGENVTAALTNRGILGQKGFSDIGQTLAAFRR